jgi:hypothetical protein
MVRLDIPRTRAVHRTPKLRPGGPVDGLSVLAGAPVQLPRPAQRAWQNWRLVWQSSSLSAVVPISAHLRVYRSEREFRSLNERLRVRMLPGWVHSCKTFSDQAKGSL